MAIPTTLVRCRKSLIGPLMLAAALSCGQPSANAGDAANEGPENGAGVALRMDSATQSIEPWIHNNMKPAVRKKLEAGFAMAVKRVSEVDTCRDLFADLGADPFETLSTGLYLPVDSYRREIEMCNRRPKTSSRVAEVLAYTSVGNAPTWVCRSFALASVETAAVTVIHEALHHAGLTEKPHDPDAMSSVAITKMVERACGFGKAHSGRSSRKASR